MNLLYFAPNTQQCDGGIRQYSAALLRELSRLENEINIFVYHDGNDPQIIDTTKDSRKLQLLTGKDLPTAPLSSRLVARALRMSNVVLRSVFGVEARPIGKPTSWIDELVEKYAIDIIHSPIQYLPDTDKAKLIVTMHDVQELHFPENFDSETRRVRAINYESYIKRASSVIVSYDHIKNDIIRFFNKPGQEVHTLLLNFDSLWFSKFLSIGPEKEKKSEDPFVLYPANTWKHKNHLNLFKAIKLLRDSRQIRVMLRLTGDYQNPWGEKLCEYLEENALGNQISFLGVVDEKALFDLYQQATGVVIPTLYEAGSFPLVESILMNRPVICSNVTSLPETINNSEALFDPEDIFSIAQKVEQLWTDPKFRIGLVANSNRASLCTHRDNAQKLKQLYKELMLPQTNDSPSKNNKTQ